MVITAAVFLLSNAAPGSPVDLIKAAGGLTPEAEQELRIQYGLDKPVIVRYGIWLGNMLRGDFGISSRTNQPVWNLVRERIGPTLILTLTSLVIALLIAVLLGIMASLKPYSAWDTASSFLAFIGASTPSFFVALVALYLFSVRLGVLPAMGMHSSGGGGLGDLALHLVLPVSVTVIRMMGTYIKQTRGSMLDVMNEEYVKTARAKGLGEGTVLIAAAVLIANLLIDLLCTYLDPKIRFD
ncbi:ABC transporter permease [Pseudoflavonifractor sp. 524-17]|uniref:ABC transporter permease n=1 Tax=Pseudoflavonifractor sp. 524-17 TaxID=2304577 RepID=UPI001FAB7484|nr:ABC transporter permease [Pseudoflavonifractor sp. 524-17]